MSNYIRIKNILPRISDGIVRGLLKTLYIYKFDFSIVKIKLTDLYDQTLEEGRAKMM